MRRGILLLCLIVLGLCCLQARAGELPLAQERELSALLLRGDYSAVVSKGERLMARYKETPPPARLYYLLMISYANLGKTMRAEDIKRILEQEYGFRLPSSAGIRKAVKASDVVLVQVGAFKSMKNARRLRDKVRSLLPGYEVSIVPSKGLFKVRVRTSRVDLSGVLAQLKAGGLDRPVVLSGTKSQ